VVNISEVGEIAGENAGGEGSGGLVVDLTNSITIRGPQRSHSGSSSALDKPLPTPPPQEHATLKPAIKLTPDVQPSSLPASLPAVGASPAHLLSPGSQHATPSTSSFSATPIMNSSPLLPKGVLGELARELKNVTDSPSTRQLLRARASAVELSRPVSSVNPDLNAQAGLLELKGAVERMRAMVAELEKGVVAGPVAVEETKEKEVPPLDRSDSDLVAILTPQLDDTESPKVPLPPPADPEPVSRRSVSTSASTPTRVHFLTTPSSPASVEEPTPIARNGTTRKVEVYDEHHDDSYEDFQPGAESSPALSRRNTYRQAAAGSSTRANATANARRTGRPSIDFPHDEEDIVLVGKGLGRMPPPLNRGSPTPSSYDNHGHGRQSPFRPSSGSVSGSGSAAARLLGRNTIASPSSARDRQPMPSWDGIRKYLPSGSGAGIDRRGSPAPGSAPGSALGGSQFYHRRALSTLARPATTESPRSSLGHARTLRSVGSFDESRELYASKGAAGEGAGGGSARTGVAGSGAGKRFSDLSTGLGPRTARAFAAAGVLPSSYKSPATASEKDFRTLERERATSSMSARRDPAAGSVADRMGTWSRLGFHRAHSDANHHTQRTGAAAGAGATFSDSTTASSPTSSGAPRAAVSSLSTVSSSNSGPSTTNVSVGNHHAIVSSLKERHELETEALLSALSEAKKEGKALRGENEELKGEIGGLSKFVEELEERLAEEVAKRKMVERQLEERKRSNERRVCGSVIWSYVCADGDPAFVGQ
jgi:hypothetical protein